MEVRYYNGVKFVYYPSTGYFVNPRTNMLMHRFIWMCEKGDIPEGYDVHHLDHNKFNNDISNLTLLTRSEHIKQHFEDSSEEFKEKTRDNMRKARFSDKCIEYHLSEAGRKQKSDTLKDCWKSGKMYKPVTYTCEICGKQYNKRRSEAKHRFCSEACRIKFEFPSRNLVCPICHKEFISKAGSAAITCSKRCSSVLCNRNRCKK